MSSLTSDVFLRLRLPAPTAARLAAAVKSSCALLIHLEAFVATWWEDGTRLTCGSGRAGA